MRLLIICALIFVGFSEALANMPTQKSLDVFKKWLNAQKGIECSVVQTRIQADGEKTESQAFILADKAGQFIFKTEGFELWNSTKYSWEYRIKAKQVLKKSVLGAKKSVSNPAQVLWGILNSAPLSVADTVIEKKHFDVYQLKLVGGLEQFSQVKLILGVQSQKPYALKLIEKNKQEQVILFKKCVALAKKTKFEFVAPLGVQEVEL
jgi:hypothetical protein